mmetsp:Transcript_3573/g.5560  ORF Transcript_3573/g.5560 Transcript_3573/m.5560 type:complete len:82 (+) Transcript_3573:100-345(+)
MSTPTPQQQQEYVNKVKAEVQAQMMQELVGKITESCFKKCTGKSGDGLDSREQSCLSNCVDRYFETMNVVNHTLASRQQGR